MFSTSLPSYRHHRGIAILIVIREPVVIAPDARERSQCSKAILIDGRPTQSLPAGTVAHNFHFILGHVKPNYCGKKNPKLV